MNTAVAESTQGNAPAQNIGFAIPINTVKSIVTELRTNGRVIRPWLGIKGKFVTDEVRNLIALPLVSGLLIIDVEDGSPAQTIGLRAGELDVTIEGEPWILGGDILVAVNGQDVKTGEQYATVLRQLKAKESIELTLFRDGTRRTITVMLGERPVGRIWVDWSDACLIVDLALLPEHRRQGIGTRVVEEVLARADRAGLPARAHVERMNGPGLAFWVRLGFEETGGDVMYSEIERPAGGPHAPGSSS